jgi:translation initiation factor 1 (eIF-1/SUI1)
MTLLEYKKAFSDLHEQLEKEYGTKAEVHIYEEKETYGRWVTTIEIKF